MKRYIIAVFLLPAFFMLFEGCKRQAPADSPTTPSDRHDKPKTESGPEMVLLPGGTFTMGDEKEPDATPHEVVVSAFYIDKYLVTQAQYQKVTGKNPSRWKAAENPVEQVRWSDAVRYCNARSRLEDLQPCYDLQTWECNFDANGYRLPTEAEWEYACRAGAGTAYCFGDSPSQLKDFAWFKDNSASKPHPVAQKKPNPWGLYDMHGNVWEWCNDFYNVDYYQESPRENPKGPKTGDTKVVRGGAWKFSADSCRSAYRYNEDPGYVDACFGYDIYGFRCVKSATMSGTSNQETIANLSP
ncbi:MAG: formylglycine-generating enzyme family protein [Sedimentisphaerales bacterium]|nr:formylglycine-generating enzyme family protein [Sedimentisphaerales bacterium]